jgi:hypothetical protein
VKNKIYINQKNSFASILAFILLLNVQIAEAQVTVQLQQPPPYQFKVERFWKLILFNNSEEPVNVYLKGTATETLQGKIVEATSSIITLQRGVKFITGRDLGPFTISESNDRYKNIILNTGSIPSGGYDICVTVYDAADGREIASDCIQTTVENFNRMELITPMDGEVLGVTFQEEVETNEPKTIQLGDFIFEITKKKKNYEWDEVVGDLKKKKDKDWDESVGDLKKKKDKDWDEAVGELKKKIDKDRDEVVGDLKKKKDYDWDEAVGDLKKKKDKDWDEAVGVLKKKKDKDWDQAVGDFNKKIDNDNDRYIERFKLMIDRYFDLTDDAFNNSKLLNRDRSISNTIKTNKNIPTIIFSWLPPVPVPANANITYRLKLVEILGYQSVFSAMKSNPLYYHSPFITGTMLRYPVAAKQLMPGKKYAWSVEAYIEGSKIQESEIRLFEIAGKEESNLQTNNFDRTQKIFDKYRLYYETELPSGLSIFTSSLYKTQRANLFSGIGQNASDDQPIIKLYGDVKFTIESNSKTPKFSQLPANIRTLEMNPQISIWNIPFRMNIYLSSLNNSNSPSINSLSFNFDHERLKSQIIDRTTDMIPDSNSDSNSNEASTIDTNNPLKSADKLGSISGVEKFFMDIKTLEVGITYPIYSELTANGVLVNGLNIEYNPGILYLAFAAGNNAAAIDNVSLKRTYMSGRLGLGKKENSHLIFTLLKMKDIQENISSPTQDVGSLLNPLIPASSAALTPQENVVFGTDINLNLFNKLIKLSGEGAVSGLTRDLNDADYESDSVPEFIKKLIVPKLSSSFDYAWKGQLEFDYEPSSTNFKFNVKRIGPGFTSFASTNFRQDQLQYDFNLVQKFVKKKITLKTFFKTYSDNLIDWKQSTTRTTSYGINLGFNFPDLPFLQLYYSPYKQKNDAINAEQKMENSSDMFSLTTGYSYPFSGMFASTIISFSGQWHNSKIGINTTEFSNTTYMLNQNLSFEFPLTLSFISSISKLIFLTIPSSMTEFNLNGDYQISENVSANLGGTISNEENLTKRVMISIGTSINLYQWLRFQLQGNIANYTDLAGGGNNYTDSMLLATALLNW